MIVGGCVPTSNIDGRSWRKSSYSGANGCVEFRQTDSIVQIRDSKDHHGPVLTFSHHAWRNLLQTLGSPGFAK
jgi:hypothetical protein